MNGTCAYYCDDDCKEHRKLIMMYLYVSEQEKIEPEPNGSFEEAKCLHARISNFSGTSDYIIDYNLFLDNSNGKKDKDYFFVYSKTKTMKLLRQYPLSAISVEIYSGKDARKLLSPKSSQVIEYQDTSTSLIKKVTGFLEEFELGDESFIYYKFESLSLTEKESYNIILPNDITYFQYNYKYSFNFQGYFSCNP